MLPKLLTQTVWKKVAKIIYPNCIFDVEENGGRGRLFLGGRALLLELRFKYIFIAVYKSAAKITNTNCL